MPIGRAIQPRTPCSTLSSAWSVTSTSSVTTIDLSKAFDSVDHDVLITKLSWYGVSDVEWFRSYLSGRRQVVRGGRLTLPMSCGIPQGSILGPILFILFTNDIYGFLTHGRLVTYADDTVHIDCAPPNETGLAELQSRLQQTMCELKTWFSANAMKMNEGKTYFLLVGSRQNLAKAANFHFEINGAVVGASKSMKILGVIVDAEPTWAAHISNVVRKCYAVLVSLYKFRHYFTPDILKVIIQAHVFTHIRYCICVWGGANKGQLHKLQKVINFAARIVTGSKKYDHITPVLSSLGWPRIENLVEHMDLVKLFKTLRGEDVPQEISALFVPRSTVSDRATRATELGRLHLRRPRLAATKRSFSYRAAAAWNCLSPEQCDAGTVRAFKAMLLRDHVF